MCNRGRKNRQLVQYIQFQTIATTVLMILTCVPPSISVLNVGRLQKSSHVDDYPLALSLA